MKNEIYCCDFFFFFFLIFLSSPSKIKERWGTRIAIIDKPSAKLSLYLLFLGLAVSLLGSAANMSTDVSLVSFFFFSLLIKFPQPERLKTSPLRTTEHMVPWAPFAALSFHILLGGKFIYALERNGVNRFIFVLFFRLPIFRIHESSLFLLWRTQRAFPDCTWIWRGWRFWNTFNFCESFNTHLKSRKNF